MPTAGDATERKIVISSDFEYNLPAYIRLSLSVRESPMKVLCSRFVDYITGYLQVSHRLYYYVDYSIFINEWQSVKKGLNK